MDNNNNNKAKKINEIRLPATEKESKNETGQKIFEQISRK